MLEIPFFRGWVYGLQDSYVTQIKGTPIKNRQYYAIQSVL